MHDYNPYLVSLEVLAGYIICALIAIIGFTVAWKIAVGTIDLSQLLTEKDASGHGSASMGRFQLLIFIFVIGVSLFLVVISNIKIVQGNRSGHELPGLPEVPKGILGLLGISASSYAVGKAIQHGAGTGDDGGSPAVRHVPVPPAEPRA
jgi:hypothetical protein